MRNILRAVAIVLMSSSATQAAEPSAMELHDTPRDLRAVEFVDGAGKSRSLMEWRGRIVVLNIWATWCPPCRAEMSTLDRLKARLGGDKFDVVALSIDRAGVPVVRKFFDKIEVKHLEIFVDDTQRSAHSLNALGLPVTILVAPDGKELARTVGPAEWDAPEMVSFFESVIEKHVSSEPKL